MSTAASPVRFDIGIVGAGRVGAVLGAALRSAGHRIHAVSAVSDESVGRAQALLPGIPIAPIPEVISGANVVLFAVPDDALAELVAGLAATEAFAPGQILIHTSGAHGVAAFDSAVNQPGAQLVPLALHPAMTFTGTELDLQRLPDARFGVTTRPEHRPIGEALVIEMGAEPVWVEEHLRPLYHAGLAHGANHLVTLVAQSLQILAAAGVEDPAAFIEPLLTAALGNTLNLGDAALTGPVARGDAGTVAGHLVTLRQLDTDAPDVRTTYAALARATLERALRSGRLSARDGASVAEALEENGPQEHPTGEQA